MECAFCLTEFTPKRSDAQYCSTNCRVKAYYARQRQAERDEIEAYRNPALADDAEQIQVLESLVLGLIRHYDPKLFSEITDRHPEDRIVYAINRAMRDEIIELPRSMSWHVKRVPILIRLVRFIWKPRRAGYLARAA